jgi:hypothetical protein
MPKTRISMKHETGLNLEMISAGNHCNITHTALEELIRTGGIVHRKDSFMLHATSNGVNPFRSWAAVKLVLIMERKKCDVAGCRRSKNSTIQYQVKRKNFYWGFSRLLSFFLPLVQVILFFLLFCPITREISEFQTELKLDGIVPN